MSILSRYLDTAEARREVENLQLNYDHLVQEHAATLGRVKRLEADLKEARAQIADYRMSAADGDTRRIAADNAHLRTERVQMIERAKVVVAERDAAVTARKVAENALNALRLNPAGDRWKTEADRHRATAARLDEDNDRLRRLVDEFEVDMAALRERLDKYRYWLVPADDLRGES